MGFATFTFFVVFLLIASGGLLLFYRAGHAAAYLRRDHAASQQAGGLSSTLQRQVSPRRHGADASNASCQRARRKSPWCSNV